MRIGTAGAAGLAALSLTLLAGTLLTGCAAGSGASAHAAGGPLAVSTARSSAPVVQRLGPSGAPRTTAAKTGRTASAAPNTPAAPVPKADKAKLGAVAGKTIVIDPGHNGGNAAHPGIMSKPVPMGTGTKACDTSGTETNSGYQETDFTFDVSIRLAALLRAAGAKVILTRQTNTGIGPCVDARAAIGNQAHAAVAVSIHGDGGPAGGHGFHVLEPARVGAPSNAIVATSHQLALKIRDNYRATSGVVASTYIGRNGINTRGDMGGLNLSTVPKVMVECGNMRNAGDAALMTNAGERQKMALGLALGIAAYLA